MNLQYTKQKYYARNLHVADCVGYRIAFPAPLIEEEAAVDLARRGEDNGCPIPEKASSDGKDQSWNTESPGYEVEG